MKKIMMLLLMWLSWSVATINSTLYLLDMYKMVKKMSNL